MAGFGAPFTGGHWWLLPPHCPSAVETCPLPTPYKTPPVIAATPPATTKTHGTTECPLDVSGGVGRFRHRRGELQRLFVEVGARDLERWAAPLLRGLLGPRSPEVWAAVRRGGATIAVVDDASGTATPRGATPGDPESVLRVLAFELKRIERRDVDLITRAAACRSGSAGPRRSST